MAWDMENRVFAEPEIVESPVDLGGWSLQNFQNQYMNPQPIDLNLGGMGNLDFSNLNLGNFDLAGFQQQYGAPNEPVYTQPTAQPVQTAPYYAEPSYTAPSYTAPSYTAPSYTAPSYAEPVYSQPTAQPLQAAPYYEEPLLPSFEAPPPPQIYGGMPEEGAYTPRTSWAGEDWLANTYVDPNGTRVFRNDANWETPLSASASGGVYNPYAANTATGATSATMQQYSPEVQRYLDEARQIAGLSTSAASAPAQGALAAAAPAAAISASSPPPGTTWGAYSDPTNPASQYTVNFNNSKKGAMPLTVSSDTPVFLYDNKTKQVLASGIGKEGADAVAAAVYQMSKDPKGSSYWDIYTGPAGATDPSQFTPVVSDAQDKNFGQRFLSAVGTMLPIAVSFIPGLQAANLLTKIGAGAAAGAGGAALKGQDILKGALIGGGTAGVMGAKVLPGGKSLSGVVGGALSDIPVVGDALQGLNKLAGSGGSYYNPVTNEIVTSATKGIAPSLVEKAAAGLIGSAAFQPNLSGLDQLQLDWPEITQQPPAQDEPPADGITVTGTKGAGLDGLASGAAGSVVSGWDPVANEITAVADKKKTNLEEPASGGAQTITSEILNPDEIVVTAKPKFEILPPNVFGGGGGGGKTTTTDTTKKDGKKDGEKDGTGKTIGTVVGGLTILDALGKVIGKIAGGGGTKGGVSPGGQQLQNVFSAKLPKASGIFANLGPRDMSGTDWLRYGYGPEKAFFQNVPTSDAERQALVSAYKPSQLPLSSFGGMPQPSSYSAAGTDTAAMLNQLTSELAAAGISEAELDAFLQTPEGQQALLAMLGGTGFAKGGSTRRAPRQSFAVEGAGTGRSDDIPAVLSDGEYVIDAETVALLGDGSSKAGAKKLDELRVNVRKHKGRNLAKGKFSANAKRPEKYLSGGRT